MKYKPLPRDNYNIFSQFMRKVDQKYMPRELRPFYSTYRPDTAAYASHELGVEGENHQQTRRQHSEKDFHDILWMIESYKDEKEAVIRDSENLIKQLESIPILNTNKRKKKQKKRLLNLTNCCFSSCSHPRPHC